MSIFIGTNKPTKIYVGTTAVKKVYVGTALCWAASETGSWNVGSYYTKYGNWNNFRPITIVNSTGETSITGTVNKWNGYTMRTGSGLGGQAGSITFTW